MIKRFKSKNSVSGFSLVEILIYLAIFTMLSVFIINSFVTVMRSFSTTRTNRDLLESGITVMERLSREIRQAKTIDLVNSNLNGGILQLNSLNESGNPMIVKFSKDVDLLNIYKDNVIFGSLLNPTISLDSLVFRRITTTNGEAIKIEMTIRDTRSRTNKSENFFNTVILRGAY